MKKQLSETLFILLVISIGLFVMYHPVYKKALAGLLLLVSFYLFLFQKPTLQIKALLLFSFLPTEEVLFLLPLLLLPRLLLNHKYKLNKVALMALIFLAYSFLVYLVSNLTVEVNLFSFPFWLLTFYSGIFLLVFYSGVGFSEKEKQDILSFFKKILYLVLFYGVAVNILVAQRFTPGDWVKSSIEDANKVAFWAGFLILLQVSPWLLKIFHNCSLLKITLRKVLALILTFGVLLLAIAKHVMVAFYVGICLYLLYYLGKRFLRASLGSAGSYSKNSLLVVISLFLLLSPVLLLVSSNLYLGVFSRTKWSLQKYITFYFSPHSPYNHKYIFYQRIFTQLPKEYSLLVGTGPGTLGSRASNARTYDTMYKPRGKRLPSFIPPFSSEPTRKYLADLYTEEYASVATERSAVLSFPFSGISSITGELGLIGLIMFFFILFLSIGKMEKTLIESNNPCLKQFALTTILAIFTIIPLLFFDNYQEKPQLMFPLYLLTALLIAPLTEDRKDS